MSRQTNILSFSDVQRKRHTSDRFLAVSEFRSVYEADLDFESPFRRQSSRAPIPYGDRATPSSSTTSPVLPPCERFSSQPLPLVQKSKPLPVGTNPFSADRYAKPFDGPSSTLHTNRSLPYFDGRGVFSASGNRCSNTAAPRSADDRNVCRLHTNDAFCHSKSDFVWDVDKDEVKDEDEVYADVVSARCTARKQSREKTRAKARAKTKTKTKAKAKAKAKRAFDKHYGATEEDARQNGAGVRAAVYKTKMGSKHRQAVRMQNDPQKHAFDTSGLLLKALQPFESPKANLVLLVATCLMLSCVFLYPQARQYYCVIREHDRLEAEYAALENRNKMLQNNVSALQTDSGIEARAHEQFGWIKQGEMTASVRGEDFDRKDSMAFFANIPPESITAPKRWYSPFLDIVFGVR